MRVRSAYAHCTHICIFLLFVCVFFIQMGAFCSRWSFSEAGWTWKYALGGRSRLGGGLAEMNLKLSWRSSQRIPLSKCWEFVSQNPRFRSGRETDNFPTLPCLFDHPMSLGDVTHGVQHTVHLSVPIFFEKKVMAIGKPLQETINCIFPVKCHVRFEKCSWWSRCAAHCAHCVGIPPPQSLTAVCWSHNKGDEVVCCGATRLEALWIRDSRCQGGILPVSAPPCSQPVVWVQTTPCGKLMFECPMPAPHSHAMPFAGCPHMVVNVVVVVFLWSAFLPRGKKNEIAQSCLVRLKIHGSLTFSLNLKWSLTEPMRNAFRRYIKHLQTETGPCFLNFFPCLVRT